MTFTVSAAAWGNETSSNVVGLNVTSAFAGICFLVKHYNIFIKLGVWYVHLHYQKYSLLSPSLCPVRGHKNTAKSEKEEY